MTNYIKLFQEPDGGIQKTNGRTLNETDQQILGWYGNRKEQLAENANNTVTADEILKTYSDRLQNTDVYDLTKYSDYNAFTQNHPYAGAIKYYFGDNASTENYPLYMAQMAMNKLNPLSGFVHGWYQPKYGVTNPSIVYTFFPSERDKVHETTHAIQGIDQYNKINEILKQNKYKKSNSYLDDAEEINSRLMEFRLHNNIDPTHKFTIEEVQKLRKQHYPLYKTKDKYQLFDRYNNDIILQLLNNVAKNTSPNETNNFTTTV